MSFSFMLIGYLVGISFPYQTLDISNVEARESDAKGRNSYYANAISSFSHHLLPNDEISSCKDSCKEYFFASDKRNYCQSKCGSKSSFCASTSQNKKCIQAYSNQSTAVRELFNTTSWTKLCDAVCPAGLGAGWVILIIVLSILFFLGLSYVIYRLLIKAVRYDTEQKLKKVIAEADAQDYLDDPLHTPSYSASNYVAPEKHGSFEDDLQYLERDLSRSSNSNKKAIYSVPSSNESSNSSYYTNKSSLAYAASPSTSGSS